MNRFTPVVILSLLCSVSSLGAQETNRGKVKKVDADKLVVTLTVDDKDRDFHVLPKTRFLGREDEPISKVLGDLKPGTEVMFRAQERDGKHVLIGLRIGGAPKKELPKVDTSKLVPLTELGAKEYQGFTGGLYPGGKNERPEAHEKAGLALARSARPLDAAGKPDPEGKIVLLSVGMSNTSQMSIGFQKALAEEKDVNPRFVFVNGAQGGMTAARIQDPESKDGASYWSTVDQRLKAAGVTPEQVQVIFIKQADAGPRDGFPAYAKKLQGELARIVQLLPQRFANVKLAYLSGRTYGGFARTPLNPDPYAYESGFSVKWLIEEQIKGAEALNYDPKRGAVKAPWLSWGPYLWANGNKKLADGFCYEESDFAADGTHHSPAGQLKVGRRLLEFLKSDSTTRPWFVAKDGK